LLSGSRPTSPGDLRRHLPRFAGESLDQNARALQAFREVAAEKGATPSQLAIAWVLAKGTNIVPLIGARRPTQLAESLGALKIALSAGDISRIEAALPPSAIAGTRYDERQMRTLDSER
jgi:aryl-alcohol dehydrogenase-like predicted oxidoreductase